MKCECGGRKKIWMRKDNGLRLYSVVCDKCGKGYRYYTRFQDAWRAYTRREENRKDE